MADKRARDHASPFMAIADKKKPADPRRGTMNKLNRRAKDPMEIESEQSIDSPVQSDTSEGRYMNKEETKTVAEAMLKIAQNIKPVDADLADGLTSEGTATILAASIAYLNNIDLATRVTPSDTAEVEAELTAIGELEPVELGEDFQERNPGEIEDDTLDSEDPGDETETSDPSAVDDEMKVRIWTKELRRVGGLLSIYCRVRNRPSTEYRHWAIEYRGVFVELQKDSKSGRISHRFPTESVKKSFDKAKTVGRSDRDTEDFIETARRVMKSRQRRGKYNYRNNNCPHYAKSVASDFLHGKNTPDAERFKISMRNFTERAIKEVQSAKKRKEGGFSG